MYKGLMYLESHIYESIQGECEMRTAHECGDLYSNVIQYIDSLPSMVIHTLDYEVSFNPVEEELERCLKNHL